MQLLGRSGYVAHFRCGRVVKQLTKIQDHLKPVLRSADCPTPEARPTAL
jgi:hypothetical protein